MSKRTRLRWLFCGAVCICLLLTWSAAFSTGLWDSTYDPLFKAYSEKYLPYDWQWTKAQAYQESRFVANARSPVGALGLMQIMPATGAEIGKIMGIHGPLTNAKINILFGTFYMRRMLGIWTSKRALLEKQRLAFAGYNAGAGWIIKSQELCGNALLWQDISPCLPMITGPSNASETITYVQRIERWFSELTICISQAGHRNDP